MKVIILAGGYGTRLSEYTESIPKPMVLIDDKPILYHIMQIFSHFGHKEFYIALGYKSKIVKDYFKRKKFPWNTYLIDTGLKTMTGGRLKRVSNYLQEEDFFCFTYGDGVSDIDIKDKINFHRKHKKLATITAVHPPSRFGALKIDNNNVVNSFKEKDEDSNDWINGGFFVLSPKVIELISDDMTIWEKQPVENLSKMGELIAYKHSGFWQPMDTLREKSKLEDLWKKNIAPWKNWK